MTKLFSKNRFVVKVTMSRRTLVTSEMQEDIGPRTQLNAPSMPWTFQQESTPISRSYLGHRILSKVDGRFKGLSAVPASHVPGLCAIQLIERLPIGSVIIFCLAFSVYFNDPEWRFLA
jgi:hypothetical protein